MRGDDGGVGKPDDAAVRQFDDLFPDGLLDAYHAFQSVNLVTAHDGFCLYDLVSYNEKHNLANGEGQRRRHGPQRQLELRVGG